MGSWNVKLPTQTGRHTWSGTLAASVADLVILKEAVTQFRGPLKAELATGPDSDGITGISISYGPVRGAWRHDVARVLTRHGLIVTAAPPASPGTVFLSAGTRTAEDV